ncbi:MAG: S41 family peptidase [Clostridiales bacterium]|nr:S41 family peptidase [Clostridiales bacterium]
MISKRKAIIGAILLVIVTAIVSSIFSIQLSTYMDIKTGDGILSGKNLSRAKRYNKLDEVRDTLERYYIEEPSDDEMMTGAIKGMVASLGDPYTYYFTEEEFEDFMERTKGSYAGVGMMVTIDEEDNQIVIIKTFEGSPAFEAGLVADDKIIKVDDMDVDGSMMDKAVAHMRGKPGTDVKVTILRDGTTKEYTLERAVVNIPDLEYKMIEDNIGYIWLYQFDENSDKNFANALNDLSKQGMEGLVVDLRGNPGGLLDTCVNIANMLVPQGIITYREDRLGNREDYKSKADYLDIPLVVLVDENSASASEVLSGAIQDYGVGTIVGKTTYGKGVVQTLKPFKDGSGLKFTNSKYFTPKGRDIHEKGVVPDIEIDLGQAAIDFLKENPNEDLPLELDIPLQGAIEEIKKKLIR